MRNPVTILCCSAVVALGAVAMACAAPPAAPSSPPYLISSQGDFIGLLPPPPAPDSEAQRQDLLAVLAAQRVARANGTTELAIADTEANCNRFGNVLGDALKGQAAAKALAFLNKAAGEVSAAAAGQAKRYWRRPRPYAVSSEVQRLGDVVPYYRRQNSARDPVSERAEIENAYLSYPSGHSTYFTACAILLAQMVPEKRAELFARGRELGLQRLVVGAHYPTDVEGGRLAGTIGIALMGTNPTFQHDFYEVRTPLRAALGLPAELPDLKAAKPKVLEDAEKAASAQ